MRKEEEEKGGHGLRREPVIREAITWHPRNYDLAHKNLLKGTERSVYNDLHPKISQSLWNIISYTDVAQRAPQNETFTWV